MKLPRTIPKQHAAHWTAIVGRSQQNTLTYDELNEGLPDTICTADQVGVWLDALNGVGIEVVDERPVPTPDRSVEIALAKEIEQAATDDARDEATGKLASLANAKIRESVARNSGINLSDDELRDIGMMAAFYAATRYEHQRGYRFETFAAWWIAQAHVREISARAERDGNQRKVDRLLMKRAKAT